MNVLDVNVVLALYRADHPHHGRARSWWEESSSRGESFTVPDSTWVGFARLVTDSRVFTRPASFDQAWDFVRTVQSAPTHLTYAADVRVLQQFERICSTSAARGALLPDAYLAAVAASLGAVVVTFDRDFRRFDDVRVEELR